MKKPKSLDQKIQEAAITDRQVDREEFKKLLVQDMRTLQVFVQEVLSIPEAVDALTNVYWERYTKLMVSKNQVPDPADVPASLQEVDPNQSNLFE